MKVTVAEARNFLSWTEFTNVCTSDPRWLQLVNEAIFRARILRGGKWVGLHRRYKVCATGAYITWPRWVETIEACWVCHRPVTPRNWWFEALPQSWGLLDHESPGMVGHIDREDGHVQFKTFTAGSKIALFSSNVVDNGKTVLLQGLDNTTGLFVRTLGDTIDGELIALNAGYVVSTTVWKPYELSGVQKALTTSPVFAYAVDSTCPSGIVASIAAFHPIAIAYWEPDETLPNYRRSLIPELDQATSCDQDADCEGTKVTIAAKLQFIQARKDTDYLMIGNVPAIASLVSAILKRRRGLWDEGAAAELEAIQLLEDELASHVGYGQVQPFKVEAGFGAGDVENYVCPFDYPISRY